VEEKLISKVPEPHVTVFTDGLFVVGEGQHGLTQAAALGERLLVQLVPDVANQDLSGMTHTHTHTIRVQSFSTKGLTFLIGTDSQHRLRKRLKIVDFT